MRTKQRWTLRLVLARRGMPTRKRSRVWTRPLLILLLRPRLRQQRRRRRNSRRLTVLLRKPRRGSPAKKTPWRRGRRPDQPWRRLGFPLLRLRQHLQILPPRLLLRWGGAQLRLSVLAPWFRRRSLREL